MDEQIKKRSGPMTGEENQRLNDELLDKLYPDRHEKRNQWAERQKEMDEAGKLS